MKLYSKILGLLVLGLISTGVNAQINPMDAQYFQNQYIANPAMAGANEGLRLNAGYRNQWSNFPGAPKDQYATLDFRTNKVGLGFSVKNEKAGLLSNTKAMGTYSYHLQFSGNKALHFGTSLSFQKENFDSYLLNANPQDPQIAEYEDRKLRVDVDFGAAYTSDNFSLEAVYYNLSNQLKKNSVDQADEAIYYAAAGYKFNFNSWSLNSKVAYRGIKNYTDIADIGLQAITNGDKLGFSAIYHSNQSTSFGVSYLHNQKWQVSGFYNTSAQAINTYANGSFEIGLQVNLDRLKR